MDFITHLQKYLSIEEITSLFDSFSQEDKHAVLLNPMKMSDGMFLTLYPHATIHPIVPHAFLYDKKEYALGKSLEYELGAFYLQEPSAMCVTSLLPLQDGDLVLDLCAAPGGKSVQASFLMHNKGLIISNDLSHERAIIIKENVERMGIEDMLIVSNDFSSIFFRYRHTFDKIILDAPCSGSGMFRKNEALKDDWTYAKVTKYASVQKELIKMAYQMLKPGGILSYSTCSFSYEEDEEVIEDLLAHSDAEILPLPTNPLFYVSPSGLGIHLFPYLFPGEGHYICQISKPGHLNSKSLSGKEAFPSCPIVKKFGDISYGMNIDFPLRDLNIIRYGVKIGEIHDHVIKYDIHYARYISSFPSILEISQEEVLAYLQGQAITKKYEPGYLLLRYHGLNVDIAKSDGRIIKCRYPKYLRKKVSV